MPAAGRMVWEQHVLQKSLVKLQSRVPLMEGGMDTGGLLQEETQTRYTEGRLMELKDKLGE
jgi:hypothetical protein